MKCNIDRKGRTARLISGVVTLIAGLVLIVLALAGVLVGGWPWVVGIAALLGGGFQIFEARAGWCAVRAMGFKTPM